MPTPPCVCPRDAEGRLTAVAPRCFDHAEWTRPKSTYVIRLSMINDPEDPEPTTTADVDGRAGFVPTTIYRSFNHECVL